MGDLIKANRYDFVGDDLSDVDREELSYGIINFGKVFPQRLQHTRKRLSELAEMSACIKLFGSDFGLDLSDTLVQDYDRQLQFFTPNGFETVREKLVVPPWVYGIKNYSTVYVQEQEKTANTYATVNHKLVHLMGLVQLEVSEGDKETTVKLIKTGYYDRETEMFRCFTEGLTELTNLEIIRNYWVKSKRLSGYVEDLSVIDHQEAVHFIDALFTDLAVKTSLGYHTILKMFQYGYIFGNDGPLSMIRQHYGAETLDFISTLPDVANEFTETVAESDLGREINFPERLVELDKVDESNTVDLKLTLFGS